MKVLKVIFRGEDNRHYEKIGNEVKDITEEIDFDLPNGWEFTRINALVYIQTGASFKKEQASNDKTKIRVLRGGNILNGLYSFFDNDLFIDRRLISDSILLRENDLLTPAVTSIENIGKLALINRNYDNVTAGGFVFIMRPFFSNLTFAKYLLYSLQSAYFNKQMKSITKKSGQAFYNLGKERLIKLILPIPPLAEQSRIVAEIEKYEPLIAEYDKLEQQKNKLDGEIYGKLKKSILQYAIQGKFVPQDERDEPASELLKRIRAEKKAQLGKKYVDSYIYKGDDNCYYEHMDSKIRDARIDVPFELPENWVWTRLTDISTKIVDGDHNPPKGENLKTDYLMISSTNINNDTIINLDKVRYLSKEMFSVENERTKATIGDILFTTVGSIGRSCIYNGKYKICLQRSVSIITTLISNRYLKICLDSPFVQSLVNKAATGTAQKGFYLNQLSQLLVCVPPLDEQKRIVDKINEIFEKL